MNFIEAHDIVNKFSKAISESDNSMTFIKYSSVKETTDRLYDAFIIFFGHAIAFNTLSVESLQNYLFMAQTIQNVVDNDTYNTANDCMNYLKNVSIFDKLFKKNKIKNAQDTFQLCLNIITNRYDTFHNSINTIDFDLFVSEMISSKQQYADNQDKLDFNTFFTSYIQKIYSYTSQKQYSYEDWVLFKPFKILKQEMLSAKGEDEIIYQKYKKNILLYSAK